MSRLLTDVYLSQRNQLTGRVMRIVRDRQTAEDLAQEAYLRACHALEAGPIEHLEAFLHQTARNLALDYLRRTRSRARFEVVDADDRLTSSVAADTPDPEAVAIDRERLRLFQDELARLPERAQNVLVLSRLEGWTNAHIAEVLGVSQRTVFNDLKLAMTHCREAMQRRDRD
ncbi:RNA polymerase sigma factor [Amorphus sp. 3PC139-8]|uniref:RNA polymerase sigma factor n=1 Tax=Amorphus sp. 3PC139-8 TaxID=2735676 RepID=UPI00345C9886